MKNKEGIIEKCPWCGEEKSNFHNHHYPIPKRFGGKDTVRICIDCHAAYHGRFIVSALDCRTEKEIKDHIQSIIVKIAREYFPCLETISWNPNLLIINPSWAWKKLKK